MESGAYSRNSIAFIIVDEIIEIRYLERFISGLTLEDRSW
jgi:hypothetical protein